MSSHNNTPPHNVESSPETTSGHTVGESVPDADYSRWMTDNWEQIADLNLGLLALVSTHNAGADMKSMWGLEELLAACQDDTFDYQLNQGVRCFDLRIRDDTYKKWIGQNQVTTEKMSFHHTVSTGRYLQDCVETMKAFASANPKELIVLSIEEYVLSTVGDSISRFYRYLAPLNNLLIPQSEGNLTLRELYQQRPSKNVIIAVPDDLKKGNSNYWGPLTKLWAGGDASLSRLKEFTRETFANIVEGHATVFEGAWMFDAQARNEFGAIRLKSDSDYFRDFFDPEKKIGQYINIVKADFIEGTGLIPFCINLNKERGKQYPAPLPPTELKAAQVDKTEQVRITWTPPTNAPTLRYDVSVNGKIELSPYASSGILPSVPPGLHSIKVRTIDTLGRRSEYCPEIKLQVNDIAPPTTPGRLRLTEIGMTSARLVWNESYDYSGIKRYQITRNGIIYSNTTELDEPISVRDLDTYRFEVRAEDNNYLWSKPARIIFAARPRTPVFPSFFLDELDWSPGKHRGVLTWQEPYPSVQDYDYQVKFAPDQIFYVAKSALSYWMLVDEGKAYTVEIRARLRGRDELSDPLIYTFTGDTVAPGKVTDLKAMDIHETSATLTWSPANGPVGRYAISVNNGVPVFVSASPCRYTTHKLVNGLDNTCEVWAVNPNGIPGLPTAINIDKVPPTTPGMPLFSDITANTASVKWDRSTDNVAVTGYVVTVNSVDITVTEPSHKLTGLQPETVYTIEVRAIDAVGNLSPSTIDSFITLPRDTVPPTQPGELVFSEGTLTSVKVTWAPSNDNIAVTGYRVAVNGLIRTVTVPSYTLIGLKPQTSYTIEVKAMDAEGNLSPSSNAIFHSLLEKPRNVNFRHVGGIGTLTWTPVADTDVSYQIEVNGTDISKGQGDFMANFRLSDVPPGPLYRMKIRARKGVYHSEYVILEETVDDSTRPGSPIGLVADNVTETSAVVSWSPPTSAQPLRGYRVSINGLYVGLVTGTSYKFPALISGVFHAVFVRAQDVSGNLSVGVGVGFRTLGDPPLPPPGKPENLHVSGQTSDLVSLRWNKPQGGTDPLGYRIACNDETFNTIAIDLQTTIEGLTSGLSYHFQVYAFDLFGQISEPAEVFLIAKFPPRSSRP